LGNAIDALHDRSRALAVTGDLDEPWTPTIWISTEAISSQWVKISIEDNGPGIPEKIQNRLFEPFFTTKGIGEGTGLGLSICYQIVVEKHGGRLQCYSQPGQGCQFVIEIPVEQHYNPRMPQKLTEVRS
jgi:signal transduction histidine kinase